MRFRETGLAVIVLAIAPAMHAERLCPAPAALPSEADDLRFAEHDFSQERYEKAIALLKQFPRELSASDDLEFSVSSSETWIPFSNALRIIEGWVLKQQAVHELKQGSRGHAAEAFCAFLSRTAHAD